VFSLGVIGVDSEVWVVSFASLRSRSATRVLREYYLHPNSQIVSQLPHKQLMSKWVNAFSVVADSGC
jgi:hypothetical protein